MSCIAHTSQEFRGCARFNSWICRALAGVLVLSLAFSLGGTSPLIAKETLDYHKVAELVSVKVIPPKEGSKRSTLEIYFNVDPNVPKGAKIEFELEYQTVK